MSIDCGCDECYTIIHIGKETICYKCYQKALDNIESLKKRIAYLEHIIEEARDE